MYLTGVLRGYDRWAIVHDGGRFRPSAVRHHPEEPCELLQLRVDGHEIAVVAHHSGKSNGTRHEVSYSINGNRDIR